MKCSQLACARWWNAITFGPEAKRFSSECLLRLSFLLVHERNIVLVFSSLRCDLLSVPKPPDSITNLLNLINKSQISSNSRLVFMRATNLLPNTQLQTSSDGHKRGCGKMKSPVIQSFPVVTAVVYASLGVYSWTPIVQSTFVVDGFPTGAGSTDPMPAWLKAEPIVVRTHDMSQRKKVRSVFGFESCPMFPSHLMLGSPHVPIWFRNSAWYAW